MAFRKKIKRVSSCLTALAFLMSSGMITETTAGNFNGINSVQVSAAENIVPGSIASVSWKPGSTATAVWDSASNANFYKITVYVYDSGKLLGSKTTETTETETDIQQEINNVYNSSGSKAGTVKVAFDVTPQYEASDGKVSGGPVSAKSGQKDYFISFDKPTYTTYTVSAPTDVKISNDLTVSWSPVKDNDKLYYYYIYYYVESTNSTSSSSTSVSASLSGSAYKNGKFQYNISDGVKKLYSSMGLSGKTAKVYAKVYAYTRSRTLNGVIYYNSPFSDFTEKVSYTYKLGEYKFKTPDDMKLDSNYVASWTADERHEKASYCTLYYRIKTSDNQVKESSVSVSGISRSSTGICQYNLASKIRSLYAASGFSGKLSEVSFAVKYYVYSDTVYDDVAYKSGDKSEYSTPVSFKETYTPYKFEIPKNISLGNDLKLSFDQVKNADKLYRYSISYKMVVNGKQYTGTSNCYSPTSSTYVKDGKFTYDLSSTIKNRYTSLGYLDEEAQVSASVQCYVDYGKVVNNVYYTSGDISAYTDPVEYSYLKKVKSLSLAPQTPIIALGRSRTIGKNISPTDAYYRSISWTSSDPKIVSVDNEGRMTANSLGKAKITAAIGEATGSIDVTVYEMVSNIGNGYTEETIIDKADDIMNDIINNDQPDVSDTDIKQEDIPALKDDIIDGLGRQDQFRTDLIWSDKPESEFSFKWKGIDDVFGDKCNFLGGYHIAIKMHHLDDAETDYNIGNITQLDTAVEISHELPENIPELEDGYIRKYAFIRLYKGCVDVLPLTIKQDGTFTSKTIKFEDFVLVYADYKDDCDTLGHDFDEKDICRRCGCSKVLDDAFKGASVTVTDGVILNFIAELTEETAGNSEAYIEFSSAQGVNRKIMISDGVCIDAKNSLYEFGIGLRPDEMSEDITAQFAYSSTKKGDMIDYSVMRYLNEIKNKDEVGEDIKDLADSMLKYGAFAQKFTGRNTQNLATEVNPYYQNAEIPNYSTPEVVGDVSGIYISDVSLMAGSNTAIVITYKKDRTFTGADSSFTCFNGNISTDMSSTSVKVTLDNILPQDLDKTYYFTVTDGEHTETIGYSAFACMGMIFEKSGTYKKELVNLLNSMYEYNIAAENVLKNI